MIHRIRAAGVLVEADCILLVGEGRLPTGERYYIPPGGGLEPTDHSLAECLQREFWEEVGLRIDVADLMYVKEYVETTTQRHHVELFFYVHRRPGPHELNPHADRPSEWFTLDRLQTVTVFPPVLKDGAWRHPPPSPHPIYLGRTEGTS